MKWKRSIAMLMLASAVLAACGADDKAAPEEKTVEQKDISSIDMVAENEQFRLFATGQMADFVADTERLATAIKEGKLEESQKLFPLVQMYYERLQPIASTFGELDTAINGPAKEGEEKKATGFNRLAYGLFVEKTTDKYDKAADNLVADVKELETHLADTNLDQTNVLQGTLNMLADTSQKRLATNSPADAEVYMVKAQAEAVEEVMTSFMARAKTEKVAEVVKANAALNEVIRFYEVGKEDYVKYSLFTNTQKQELTDAVVAVEKAFDEMMKTVQ